MEKEIENIVHPAPRTREMQDTINHLILGITMWTSASLTCITTLIAVGNPWCLIVLLLPFVYTMFPQIQKFTTAMAESGYAKYKAMKREVKDDRKAEKKQSKESEKPAEIVTIQQPELESETQDEPINMTEYHAQSN